MPLENLVAKDISMVHEIRALDGDMQMLVYENYNKFISATETIKRMKTNVDAMDDDMEDVRMKMEKIAKTSRRIDSNLAENRGKVDKLVRVRRLLSRLEFLSELPEKLAEMISKEMYKEAVTLYSKTIKVLTSHSHVLSFKNIKERTERMMQDLRGKVMDLLDDPALEAVKLTQHVTVLRLMESPRDKVVEKLLSAHRHRTTRMTKQYQQVLAQGEADNADVAGSVANARKFHQSLVVGLIEACKGIAELFSDILEGGPGPAPDAPADSAPVSPESASRQRTSVESMGADAYVQLQKCLTNLMQDYTNCLVDSFQQFFKRFDAHVRACGESEKGEEGGTARSLQLRTYEFEEERQSWMMLARQAILDCQYLDKAAKDCAPLGGGKAPRTVHATSFASSILAVLESHNEAAFGRRLVGLLTTLTKHAALALAPVCQMVSRSKGSADHTYPDPYVARTAIQQRSAQAKAQLDKTNDVFAACFADICSDYKPIIEIHTVTAAAAASSSSSAGGLRTRSSSGAVGPTAVCHSSLLVEKYVEAVCSATETLAGVEAGFHIFKINNDTNANENTTEDIYTESSHRGRRMDLDCTALTQILKDTDAKVNVRRFFAVVTSVALRRWAPVVCKRLNVELQLQELDTVAVNTGLRDRCQRRVEGSADVLLASFIESNSSHRAHQLTRALFAQVGPAGGTSTGTPTASGGSGSGSGSGNGSGSGSGTPLVDFAVGLDALATTCCVLFAEPPPPPILSSASVERDLNRMRSGAAAARQSGGARVGLQLDIERLFAQQIRVFDGTTLTSPTLDAVLGTVLKAALKSAQEHCRLCGWRGQAEQGLRMQAEMMFVKQVACAVLKDPSPCDALADQVSDDE
jgi:hypothetical protein